MCVCIDWLICMYMGSPHVPSDTLPVMAVLSRVKVPCGGFGIMGRGVSWSFCQSEAAVGQVFLEGAPCFRGRRGT